MNRWNKYYQEHGYWEFKHPNGKLWCKLTLNNEMYLGYLERYHENGKIEYKGISI